MCPEGLSEGLKPKGQELHTLLVILRNDTFFLQVEITLPLRCKKQQIRTTLPLPNPQLLMLLLRKL